VPSGAAWAVVARHPVLGIYHAYGAQTATPLFTENESNAERLWGLANASPYVKDAFQRRLVAGDEAAINPALRGTKFAAWTPRHCDRSRDLSQPASSARVRCRYPG
jgi:hypothetical protein